MVETMTRTELVRLFKLEVDNRAESIDSAQEQDWFSLTLGWAIAKGLAPQDAHDFAIFIRHQTDLG